MTPTQSFPKTIVLVEDDTFIAGMYADKLSREQYAVKLATDGEAGLALVRQERPDLVLLDLKLPKRSGVEVLQALKADAKTKTIPVIVLTNSSDATDIERCVALGAVDYIVKVNLEPAEVVARIDRFLRRSF